MIVIIRRMIVVRGARVLARIPYPAIARTPRRDELRCVAHMLISLRIIHACDAVGPQAPDIGALINIATNAMRHTQLVSEHARHHRLTDWLKATMPERVHRQGDLLAMRMLDAMAER